MRETLVGINSPFGGTMKSDEFCDASVFGTDVTATNSYIPQVGCIFSVSFFRGNWRAEYDEAKRQLGQPMAESPSAEGITATWASTRQEIPDPISVQTIGRRKFEAIIDKNRVLESEIQVVKDLLILHQMFSMMPMLSPDRLRAVAVCLQDIPADRRKLIMMVQLEICEAYASARSQNLH